MLYKFHFFNEMTLTDTQYVKGTTKSCYISLCNLLYSIIIILFDLAAQCVLLVFTHIYMFLLNNNKLPTFFPFFFVNKNILRRHYFKLDIFFLLLHFPLLLHLHINSYYVLAFCHNIFTKYLLI